MVRKLYFLAAVSVLFPSLIFAQAGQKILLKVNLGDGAVGDFLGEESVFDVEADQYAKQSFRGVIQQTDQPELFQKQRFSRDHDLTIRAPVPDGVYSVTLLMAETYEPACKPGSRVFDIALGTPQSGLTTQVSDFDLFANAGCQTAFGKRFENIVSKDGIVISLQAKRQHPVLAGFIVEGYPVAKGDGKEFQAVGQVSEPQPPGTLTSRHTAQERGTSAFGASTAGVSDQGADPSALMGSGGAAGAGSFAGGAGEGDLSSGEAAGAGGFGSASSVAAGGAAAFGAPGAGGFMAGGAPGAQVGSGMGGAQPGGQTGGFQQPGGAMGAGGFAAGGAPPMRRRLLHHKRRRSRRSGAGMYGNGAPHGGGAGYGAPSAGMLGGQYRGFRQ